MSRRLLSAGFLLLAVGCVKTRPTEAQDAGTTAVSSALSVERCEALLIDAERALSQARAAAPQACTTAGDCTLAETSACYPGCADWALAKAGMAEYAATRDALRAGACKAWSEGGCATTTPKPAPKCGVASVACTNGKCVAAPP